MTLLAGYCRLGAVDSDCGNAIIQTRVACERKLYPVSSEYADALQGRHVVAYGADEIVYSLIAALGGQ